jgi:hypothetical protein
MSKKELLPHFVVPPEIHYRVKVYAAEQKKSMADIVVMLIKAGFDHILNKESIGGEKPTA